MAREELRGLRPDLAAAARRLGSRLRDPGELVPVAAYVRPDETVRFLALGTYERGAGLLVLTDARVLFFLRRVEQPLLDLPLSRIGSVTTTAGLISGEVALEVGELEVGGEVLAVSRIVKADVEPLAHALRQAVEVAPEESPPPEQEPQPQSPQGAGLDPFEAMEKLSALRDRGVLTEEEFAAKKQELLDRL